MSGGCNANVVLRANSASPNPLAGFEGPLRSGGKRGEGKKGGERKGRQGSEGTGKTPPHPKEINSGYDLVSVKSNARWRVVRNGQQISAHFY